MHRAEADIRFRLLMTTTPTNGRAKSAADNSQLQTTNAGPLANRYLVNSPIMDSRASARLPDGVSDAVAASFASRNNHS